MDEGDSLLQNIEKKKKELHDTELNSVEVANEPAGQR